METVGQDVEQEAADELVGIEGHHLLLAMVAIVLPQEADVAVGESDEAAVGDSDAMGIAGEMIEHLLGSAERSLGIDDPGSGAQLPQAGSEQSSRGQACQSAEKPELVCIERRLEAGQEKPAIEPRQHLHRQKEPRPAADPAGPIDRGPATWHDAVHMGMMMQVLSPAVQDGDQPDLGAEVLGIGSDDAQRLGRCGEQDGVDNGLVLEGNLGNRRRHGENDREVRHRQQVGLAVRQPFGTGQPLALRAMPVAARNGRRPLPALWAKPVMGSWRSR
jgi:hypothetical protein